MMLRTPGGIQNGIIVAHAIVRISHIPTNVQVEPTRDQFECNHRRTRRYRTLLIKLYGDPPRPYKHGQARDIDRFDPRSSPSRTWRVNPNTQ
ncbi:hypothetical protein AZE42_06226 [Rhizopogon vesiculosus]|uniref:Uncharacterized protein n=1 Tax=Rhizopogon vesiculosus TaxID=180088 RepID=A0A1J8QUM9_9AGAM|nr:hypothetical protein AZE42_06226 [Rhizopogon vesiculosus]